MSFVLTFVCMDNPPMTLLGPFSYTVEPDPQLSLLPPLPHVSLIQDVHPDFLGLPPNLYPYSLLFLSYY